MSITEILLLSVGLAMDAFAVSICKGIAIKKMDWNKAGIIGLYFGGFQVLMPLLGFLLGITFEKLITSIDHWIAFVLLGFIGFNMIREAVKGEDKQDENADLSFKTMIVLAIATSIDALAVGITFAFFNVNMPFALSSIGIITFLMSFVGTWIGHRFGSTFNKGAEIAGGIILILLGTKILLEHLGIISF